MWVLQDMRRAQGGWNGDPGDEFVERSAVTMHCGLGNGSDKSPSVEVARAR